MSSIEAIHQLLIRQMAAEVSLRSLIATAEKDVVDDTAGLEGQIEKTVGATLRLTRQIWAHKITCATNELPAPSAEVADEVPADSGQARARLGSMRATISRVVEGIEDDLQGIDQYRQAHARVVLRLQVALAIALVLVIYVASTAFDRFSKAQAAFASAVSALNLGDFASFDRGIAEANQQIPGHRSSEAAERRRNAEEGELKYGRILEAWKRNDVAAFDTEMASLRALSPGYRTLAVSQLELAKATSVLGPGNNLSIRAPISVELVLIPGGSYTMGSKPASDRNWDRDELPEHAVALADFWIGRTEITNDQYAAYANSGRLNMIVPAGKGRQPVVNLALSDAQGFATWLSEKTGLLVRLPTEEEWEKACRGTDARIFPWGDSFDKTRVNSSEGGPGRITEVGAYSPQGDSPLGVVDMAGNVWEWTLSNYTSDYQPGAKPDAGNRVLRGGGFNGNQSYARCTDRIRYDPVNRSYSSGFRVVVIPIL